MRAELFDTDVEAWEARELRRKFVWFPRGWRGIFTRGGIVTRRTVRIPAPLRSVLTGGGVIDGADLEALDPVDVSALLADIDDAGLTDLHGRLETLVSDDAWEARHELDYAA